MGFDGEQGLGGHAPQSAYLSARYESRREDTDWSVLDYLQGNTELNPSQDIDGKKIDPASLERVIRDLRLGDLINMPVSIVSNGQTRRARIPKALYLGIQSYVTRRALHGTGSSYAVDSESNVATFGRGECTQAYLDAQAARPYSGLDYHISCFSKEIVGCLSRTKEDVLQQLREYVKDVKEGKAEPDFHMPLNSISEVGRKLTANGVIEPTTPPQKPILSVHVNVVGAS